MINVDYDLPFGVGRQFVNHPGVLDEIVGGWKTDMEWWVQGGQPFTVGISRISGWQNANGGLANSAVKVANPWSSNLQPAGQLQRPAHQQRHDHRDAVEYSRECLRGAHPAQGRAGSTRAPLPTRWAS